MASLFAVRVRPMESDDHRHVLAVERACFSNGWTDEEFAFHFGRGVYPDGSGFEQPRAIATSDTVKVTTPYLFVAEATSSLWPLKILQRAGILRWRRIGFVLAHFIEDTAHIENIAVLAPYRGIGIGRSLVDYLGNAIAEVDRIMVAAAESDVDTIRFFQAIGFSVEGLCGEGEFSCDDDVVVDGVLLVRHY